MAREADLFAEARERSFSCVNKGQCDNYGATQNKPEKADTNKPSGKKDISDSSVEAHGMQIKNDDAPSRGRA